MSIITRDSGKLILRERFKVPVGYIFSNLTANKKLGKGYFVNLGNYKDKCYSINMRTFSLASSLKPKRQVAVSGTWKLSVSLLPKDAIRVVKSTELPIGSVFTFKTSDTVYASLGYPGAEQSSLLYMNLEDNKRLGKVREITEAILVGDWRMESTAV